MYAKKNERLIQNDAKAKIQEAEAKGFINKIKQEQRIQKQLQQAEKQFKQKKYSSAFSKLKKAIKSSDRSGISSTYNLKLWKLLPIYRQKHQVYKATAQFDLQLQQLMQKEKGLKNIRSSWKRKRIKRKLLKKIQKLQRAKKRAERKLVKAQSKAQETHNQGKKLFRKGDLQEAKAAFKKSQNDMMVTLVSKFQSFLRKGKRAHNNRNVAVAIPILKKALSLDRLLSGDQKSVFTKELKNQLASMYLFKGKALFNQKKFGLAAIHYRKALSYKKPFPEAKAKNKQVEAIFANWLKRAKQQLQSNQPKEAKRTLLTILAQVPNSSRLRTQAKKLLTQ